MPEESATIQMLQPIAKYVLLPIWFALLVYIFTEILCIRKGIGLREGVHGKTFLMAGMSSIFWIATSVIPPTIMMPMDAIPIRTLMAIFSIVVTLHFIIFYLSEMIAPSNTLRELAVGAGILDTRIAVTKSAKMASKDEELANDSTATITLSNASMIIRNLAIMTIAGIAFNAYSFPPLFFWVSMLSMAIIFIVGHFFFSWKSEKKGKTEYSFFSPKNTMLVLIIVLVVYYLAFFANAKMGAIGLYIVIGLAGLLYGGIPISILLGLMLAGKISAMVALYATVIGTSASIFSGILYSYLAGAKKLATYLIIITAAAVAIGLGIMLILV
jgi:uncharacterized membrane protein (DUF4010 family)